MSEQEAWGEYGECAGCGEATRLVTVDGDGAAEVCTSCGRGNWTTGEDEAMTYDEVADRPGPDERGVRHGFDRIDEDGRGVCVCGWTTAALPTTPADPRVGVVGHVVWARGIDPAMQPEPRPFAVGDEVRIVSGFLGAGRVGVVQAVRGGVVDVEFIGPVYALAPDGEKETKRLPYAPHELRHADDVL
jgi:hypothetical protein